MKQFVIAALMLLAMTTMKATAQTQGSGLGQPTYRTNVFQNWQAFNGIAYLNAGAIANANMAINSTVTTALEVDSSNKYTTSGNWQVVSKWAAHSDSLKLLSSSYSAGQIINLLSVKTGGDSTIIWTSSGTINGAASLVWTQATYGTYRKLSLLYDGKNYWICR